MKMGEKKRVIWWTLILLIFIVVTASAADQATAQDSTRQTTITVNYTEYEWWLMRWTDNQILCQVFVDHEGLPTAEEVYNVCGEDIGDKWYSTPPCMNILEGNKDTRSCAGLYLHLTSSADKEREIIIDLPPAVVWITLDGCSPTPPENFCPTLPSLLFIGEEPLPNEEITAINGLYDGIPFYCEGERCAFPLSVTPEEGVTVEFWADSSYGDSSEVFTARLRVVESGVSPVPGSSGYFIDVLSTQWLGGEIASCAQSWEALPPIGRPPEWLSTPDQTGLLASDEAYYYLAGRLITQGIVDARSCPTGGLLPNGYADACGLEAAQPQVEVWQNQFDTRIIETWQETGVPGQLLKNLFAQESQFWPGVFRVRYEFGLGQITDNGADTILIWDSEFYDQFCPLMLAKDTCDRGYIHLDEDESALLRGALAVQVKVDCPSCPTGIDLTNTYYTVPLFARTLLASCEQVGQIVYNATGEIAGNVSSYEDLWRFTVANYHAGPGCLSYAAHIAWANNGLELLWEEVATRFTEPCQGVVPYVNKITH
jgi:hypothetical protein